MNQNQNKLTVVVTLLRVLIGWHFLYEGILKIYNPDWTSYGYLASAQGPLKSVFTALANDSIIYWVDTLNMAALVIAGVTLILGVFERLGACIGVGLLTMYYLSHPPFPGLTQLNTEGSYWFVNKNLIELVALLVVYYLPTGQKFGLSALRKQQLAKTDAS
ncbi:MAG: DoxX family membrane protein [Bacteroidota bacterium]